MLPEAIDNLAEKFRTLPGVGYRGSMKMALDILQMEEDKYQDLVDSMNKIKTDVVICPNCGFFSQKDKTNTSQLCNICSNTTRSKTQICLVEKPTDVITIEKSGVYRGYYHVLNFLISPLDNIFVEDTTLLDLIDRRLVELSNKVENIELILFFKIGFEAEATTTYLREALQDRGFGEKVKISRLAQGLPMYYNPDTLDQATMAKALEDRRQI